MGNIHNHYHYHDKESVKQLKEELARERQSFQQELEKAIKQGQDAKEKFNSTMETGLEVMRGAHIPVVLLFGNAGIGKTTLLKFLFGINDPRCEPIPGDRHGTTELCDFVSPVDGLRYLDTVGSPESLEGFCRILACALCRGWYPAHILVVHSGRTCNLEELAFKLNTTFNLLKFHSLGFWNLIAAGNDENRATYLRLSIPDPTPHTSRHIKNLSFTNLELADSNFLQNLDIFGDMDYDQYMNDPIPGMTTAYKVARTIVQRREFSGTDKAFMEQVM